MATASITSHHLEQIGGNKMAYRQCRKIVCATVRQLPEGGGETANGNGERNHKQIGDTVLKATGDKTG